MKSTEYIEWDKLEQIPFCLCRIAEDEENQEIDVYYLDKRVCHDYDHVGHYFRTAIIMFRRMCYNNRFATLAYWIFTLVGTGGPALWHRPFPDL